MTFLYIGMAIDCSKSNLHVWKCSGYCNITVTVLAGEGGGRGRMTSGEEAR